MDFIVSIRSREKRDATKLQNFHLGVLTEGADFDTLFPKQGQDAFIHVLLPNQKEFHRVELMPCFWNGCRHFGSDDILAWIREKNHDKYDDKPPRFHAKKDPENENHFEVLGLVGE